MPASAVPVSVVGLPSANRERIVVRSSRGCPSCGEWTCADPDDCLHLLMSLPWGDCDFCAGSGWGGEDTPSIFCEWCAGSGLQEFTLGDTPPLCTRAAERLAAHIDRLRALTAVAA